MNLMKKELSKVVEAKKLQKNRLRSLKDDYLAIIYKGVSTQKDYNKIREDLIKMTLNRKKKGVYSPKMLKVALSIAGDLKKSTTNIPYITGQVEKIYSPTNTSASSVLAIWTFHLMDNRKVEKRLNSIVTKEADKVEADSKHEAIDLALTTNREDNKEIVKNNAGWENLKIFYLASKHNDSATDHKDWQGKVYIDEKWLHLNLPDSVANSIKQYILKNNIKTMQWVIGKPVWFVTRPNCRHYFKDITLKEALGSSKTSLIEKYGLTTPIGDRQYMQTISKAKSNDQYDEIRNAQLMLESYEQRLSYHQQLYKENPSELLRNAINKDKLLIKKWKEVLMQRRIK